MGSGLVDLLDPDSLDPGDSLRGRANIGGLVALLRDWTQHGAIGFKEQAGQG